MENRSHALESKKRVAKAKTKSVWHLFWYLRVYYYVRRAITNLLQL